MSYTEAQRELLNRLGASVRTARQEKGLSQEQLALLCGLDRTYVSGIERGKRNVAVLNLYKLALALELPVTDLLPRPSENE